MSSVNEGDIKIEEPGPGYAVGSTTESPSLNSVATQEMANDPIERTNLQLTSTSSPPSPKVNEPNRGNASIEHLRRKQPRTRSTRYKCKRCESTFRDQHELDHHENVHVHRNWHETARSRAPTKRVRNVYRRPLKPRSPIWECGFCQITLASQNERHYHIRDCKAAKGINTAVASKRSVLEEGTQSLEHAKTWTWSWNTKTEAGTSLDIDTARHFVENDSCLKGLDDVFGPSISGKELFDLAPIAWSNSMPEEYSVFAHTPKRYSTLLHSSEELKSPSPKAPYCPVKDIFCPPPPPRHQNVSAASIDIPAPSLSTKSSKSSLDSGYWSQSVESCGTGGEMSMTGNPEKAGSLLSWLNDEEILPGRDEYVSQALFWFRDGKTSGGRENDQHLDYSLSQENRRWGTSASKESSGTGSLANLDAVPRKMKEQCGGWKGAADCNLVDRKGNDKTCSRTVSPASLGSTAVVSDSGRSQNTANDCGSDENHSSPHTSHSNRGSRSSSLRGSSVGDLTELDNSSGELCSTPGTSSASTEDTSSLFDTTNSLNSTDSSPSPPPAMETRKRKIIDHLMGCLEVFLATYDCHGEPRAVTKNGKSKSRATRAAESNSQSKEQLLVNTGIKRQRGDFTDDDAQDIDEINQPRVKRAKSPSTDIPSPLFACPYYKYNPRKYRRWRTCFGPGWRSVHRVKEHLYRLHKLPIQCPRCRHTFPSEERLQHHHRSQVPCEVNNSPPLEGFDSFQEKRLRSRKKEQPDMTEEDKWRKAYRILFPNDDYSNMPYYGDHYAQKIGESTASTDAELARYGEFLREELPASVQQELEERLDGLLDNAEENLRDQLPTIVRDTQIQLFQHYVQLRTAESTETTHAASEQPEVSDDAQNETNVVATQTENPEIASDAVEQLPAAELQNLTDLFPGFDGTLFAMPDTGPLQPHTEQNMLPEGDIFESTELEIENAFSIMGKFEDMGTFDNVFDFLEAVPW